MSYELTSSEKSAVSMLSPEGRYDYFVNKVARNGEVWSLEGDDGWVVMRSEDGDECLPVWPHADFAAQWADGDWAGCRPAAIELDTWMERWTPGMEQDGTLLAVFPDEEGEGTIVTPTELHASIEGALKKQ
jgi:hypothetical protein